MLNIGTSFLVTPMMSLVLMSAYAVTTGRMDANFLYAVQSLFDITKYALLALPSAVRACSGAAASYNRIVECVSHFYSRTLVFFLNILRRYFLRPPYDDKREMIGLDPSSANANSIGSVQLMKLPVGPKSTLQVTN